VRVARRLIESESDRMAPGDEGVRRLTPEEVARAPQLAALARSAQERGAARGFVLLERGLCLAAGRFDPATGSTTVLLRELRGDNRLPDQIRNVVFGSPPKGQPVRATLTIFEGDVRIATNVMTPFGERAVGTQASPEVARRVLIEGRPWNDRAKVLERWTIASYEPIRSTGGEVLGMLYAGLDEGPYVAQGRRDIAMFLASIAVLTFVVSVLVGWLARRVTQPLKALTSAAAALGAGAPKPIPIALSDSEETRVLGETFNRMANRIQAHAAALEAGRETTQKALDDYMEVLGFVAHELKSPLAGAKMQLQLFDGGYLGEIPEAMKRPLAGIGRAIDYGNEVAQSFNQLSRAEGEGFAARPCELADFAAEVIRPALADFEAAAAARAMTLALEGEAGGICADPDLMRVAMDNLIGNAIKYGREKSKISITARRTPAGLRVEVRNEGVGVKPESIPKLFQKFFRIHDPATATTKGTGVGLYLVRRFVEMHGGRVGVEGEYGSWVTFWFEIPGPPESLDAYRNHGVPKNPA
jgi:two-component system NtrC family sensor kinase